jgi:hypothetical protein
MKEVLMIFVFAVFFAGNAYSQPVPNQKEDGKQKTNQPVVIAGGEQEEELPAPAPLVIAGGEEEEAFLAPVQPQALMNGEPQTEPTTRLWYFIGGILGRCIML